MGGGDKGFLPLAGRPLLDHVIERLRPQVSRIILNAVGDPVRFARWDLTVVADTVAGLTAHSGGPLAGVLAAMRWARQNALAGDILSVPTDTPFLPADLVSRLWAVRERAAAPIALAASGGRRHPVIGLWSLALEPLLARALAEGEHRVGAWALAQGAATAEWVCEGIDPFLNLNRPEELAEAERLARPTVRG